jgi:hypothetical protein
LLCLLALDPPAAAQGGGFGDFLSHMFGGGSEAKPGEAPTQAAPHAPRKPHKRILTERVRDFVPASATRAPGAPGGAPAKVSFTIEVVGDSLATLAADGLTEAFADKPEIAVVNKAREPSGLVRDDYFDWSKTSLELATGKDKMDFVVAMFGVNDVQASRDGAETFSDRWLTQYRQHVQGVLAPFQNAHIPLAWVGLPPMRSEKFNAAVIKLNEIYREEVEKAGDKYIDIWDAFTDQNGQYDAFGPNIDGQSVKLRGIDGIHLTKAGSRKLAHFLEAEIRRVFDKNAPQTELANLPPDIEHAADDINAQIRREMGAAPASAPATGAAPQAPPKRLAGPILSLTARPLSPGGALATRDAKIASGTDEAARELRVGDPVASRNGRADDFSWPRL